MLECSGKEIYLVCGITDTRNGLDGLAVIANLRSAGDSFESAMFIFCSRSRNRVKIIEISNSRA